MANYSEKVSSSLEKRLELATLALLAPIVIKTLSESTYDAFLKRIENG